MTIKNLKLGDYIQHIETGKVIEVDDYILNSYFDIDGGIVIGLLDAEIYGLERKPHYTKDFRFYRTKRGFRAGDVVEVVDNSLCQKDIPVGTRATISQSEANSLNSAGGICWQNLGRYIFETWQFRVVEEAEKKYSISVLLQASPLNTHYMKTLIEEASRREEARNAFKAFASYAEKINKVNNYCLDVFRYMSPLYQNYNHIQKKGANNMEVDSKSTKLYFKDSNGNMIDAEFPSTETIKLMEKFEMERFDDNKIPMFWKKVDRIYHNDKTVIVYWTDGTSTRATCSEDDTFDIMVGLLIAVGKKAFSSKEQLVKIADKLATNGVFENTSSVKE